MTYMHALHPKIILGLVQNEHCAAKSLWGPYIMKNCARPPPSQGGREGGGRKHGCGVELRVIAGLHPRNPAMTYMHALSTEIALGCVQNQML